MPGFSKFATASVQATAWAPASAEVVPAIVILDDVDHDVRGDETTAITVYRTAAARIENSTVESDEIHACERRRLVRKWGKGARITMVDLGDPTLLTTS